LTMAFPGRMALRPMQTCLEVAFDQSRGLGTLSELLTQSGQRAGRVLEQIDCSPLGPVIVLRDETYFQDWPILLVLEPVTTTILLGVVSEDCQAETWGAALLVTQDSGVHIKGLVEDMARMYPKSQELAEIEVSVQKDTWHIEKWGGKVRHDLQRIALAAQRKVYGLEKRLLKAWDDTLFLNQYISAVEKADRLMERHDTFRCWRLISLTRLNNNSSCAPWPVPGACANLSSMDSDPENGRPPKQKPCWSTCWTGTKPASRWLPT